MYVKCTIRKEDGTMLMETYGVPTQFKNLRLPRYALIRTEKDAPTYKQGRWFLHKDAAEKAMADDNAHLDPNGIWGPEEMGRVEYELIKEKEDR